MAIAFVMLMLVFCREAVTGIETDENYIPFVRNMSPKKQKRGGIAMHAVPSSPVPTEVDSAAEIPPISDVSVSPVHA